jgi:glutathione synthase/RimK-type ligase-like ATP-grasp enzyme
MTKLLIVTRADDSHAMTVKQALEKQKHQVDLWYPAEYPAKLAYSCVISDKKIAWNICGESWKAKQHYDVVWYRRPAQPMLPDNLHPDDISNAKRENTVFTQNLWQLIYPDAKWINSVSASIKANSKLLQLNIASSAGLKIPDTLISNDPRLIKNCIAKNDLVYKTLHPMIWLNKDELRLTYTRNISLADLPSDKTLRSTPGIYQEKISKQYELRVTYFGNRYIAVKIDSQRLDSAKMDWREAPTKKLSLEKVTLPDTIDKACRTVMANLGIIFGCFDLIVTPDDDYYFLEVNEQGQFLWIEDVNPEIKMLQPFCEFITSL